MDPKLAGWIKRNFARFGFRIERIDPENPDPWSTDGEFLSLYEEIRSRTLVTIDRCHCLYQLSRLGARLPGAMAEVGVYRGGTARLLARACPDKPLLLFDTFGGMPAVDSDVDRHREGDFADTSLESVRAFLEGCRNAEFYPGWFPESADGTPKREFALVHIDVDIYQSVRDALEYFYPRVNPGGVLVIDDYRWKHCPGVEKAVHAFAEVHALTPLVFARYQCVLIRPHPPADSDGGR